MVRRLLWWLLVAGPRRLGWAVTLAARVAGMAVGAWLGSLLFGLPYIDALAGASLAVAGLYLAGWAWEAKSKRASHRTQGGTAETVGALHDRLPPNVWVNLPEYGVRVKRVGEESRDG